MLLAAVAITAFATASAYGAPAARDGRADDGHVHSGDAIIVTASTLDLLGLADTSSQGAVTRQEIQMRPVYRVGQLLETVPGLAVTAHSGEGKANQYLLRGFNLDHGTDLATYIDGMPVNMRTHAHGQGYTDLNFMIPELASGIRFSKGPYFAAEGDFAAVGATHIDYANALPLQFSASVGTVDDERLFGAGTIDLGDGRNLLAAAELVHTDGPWDHGDNFRKRNAVLRYSQGDAANGLSITGMYYHGRWNATNDQPRRAVEQGLIGRLGTLDPSDGGKSGRASISAMFGHQWDDWTLQANAYFIHQTLTLWNNFTHYLDDPVNGDQHAQDDRRNFYGGAASLARDWSVGSVENETSVGVQARRDDITVDLKHTRMRSVLSTDVADRVNETSVGAYVQNRTNWTPWLRSIVGLREDYFHVRDRNIAGGTSGSEGKSLFQPKGSLIFGPWAKTEFYLSAGRGFHSNDGRAGTAVDVQTGNAERARPALIARASMMEMGIRTSAIPHLQAAVTLFQADFASELTYDADAGQTDAGRPSRRRGVEITAQYRPAYWLEINTNLAFSHARYRDDDPAGRHVEDAPSFIGSAGLLIDHLGGWFGAVEYRNLGAHALVEDNSVRSPGYQEINANIGYKLTSWLKLRLDVYNITNSHDDAADYYYTSRLPGEPAEGIESIQSHPLEPRSARLTLSATF